MLFDFDFHHLGFAIVFFFYLDFGFLHFGFNLCLCLCLEEHELVLDEELYDVLQSKHFAEETCTFPLSGLFALMWHTLSLLPNLTLARIS